MDQDPVYAPQERNIFGPYWNGACMAHADPLACHIRLTHALDGEPGAFLRRAKSANEHERYEALVRIDQASREVFGLAPFDPESGGGAQMADSFAVFKTFVEWIKKKEPPFPASPTMPPATPEA